MNVRKALNELDLKDDDIIFMHRYGKADFDNHTEAKDIPEDILKKQFVICRPHYGGIDNDYNAYQIIYK